MSFQFSGGTSALCCLYACGRIIDGCSNGYVCLDLNNGEEWNRKVIVDAQAMRETTRRVMKRNQIPSDRSEDLRKRAAQ